MTSDMTSGSPSRHIITFMLPVLVGNMLMQGYNLVDSIIVGRFVGVNALAAIGAVTYMNWLMLGFGGAMVQGFAILTAQRFGSHDYAGMRNAVAMSFLITAGMCVILSISGLLAAKPLLVVLNTPREIINDAHRYISIIYTFMGVFLFTNLLNSHLRALGDSRSPFVALLIASLIKGLY